MIEEFPASPTVALPVELKDYSPPANPSLEEQETALRKGLGRAWQWAATGRLDREVLLAACLGDWRFDKQCETVRGNWLWNLIVQAEAQEFVHDRFLTATRQVDNETVGAYQTCQLLLHFARWGSEQAREELFRIVETAPWDDYPGIGTEELMLLDGESGFLFSARALGRRLEREAWEWWAANFAFDAEKLLGKARTVELLSASTDADIKRFHQLWLEATSTESPGTVPLRVEGLGFDDALATIGNQSSGIALWNWGRQATSAQLIEVFSRILDSDDDGFIQLALQVFHDVAPPSFDERLFSLCLHSNRTISIRAYRALSHFILPEVREFALQQIASGMSSKSIKLLAVNSRPGDEELIFSLLQLGGELDEIHWQLMACCEFIERNLRPAGERLALLVYGESPCQICRHRAFSFLTELGLAPYWMHDEYQFDAEQLAINEDSDSQP